MKMTEKWRGNFLLSLPASIFHFCLLMLKRPIADPPN
jgi:hypothetical protein